MASSNLQNTEKRSGHLTIQTPVYIGSHMFKINEQYEFTEIQWHLVGCGCGGKKKVSTKYYLVTVGVNKFSVEAKHVVETNVAIPKASQNFDVARRDQHRYPGTDFSSIVAHPDPDAILKHANEQATDGYHHNDWS